MCLTTRTIYTCGHTYAAEDWTISCADRHAFDPYHTRPAQWYHEQFGGTVDHTTWRCPWRCDHCRQAETTDDVGDGRDWSAAGNDERAERKEMIDQAVCVSPVRRTESEDDPESPGEEWGVGGEG